MKKPAPRKVKVTAEHIEQHRKKPKTHAPSWANVDKMNLDEFKTKFKHSMDYWQATISAKDAKSHVLKWMRKYSSHDDCEAMKKIEDWRCSITMAAIAENLLHGMPAEFPEFNNSHNSEIWLRARIGEEIQRGSTDLIDESEITKPIASIQDRTREAANRMTEALEDAINSWFKLGENFDPNQYNVFKILTDAGAKAGHVRFIKEFYHREFEELIELSSGNAPDDLKEAYSNRSKKAIKKLLAFYQEIMASCNMIEQTAKVERKPKAKTVDKTKIIANVKFKPNDDILKLVSINPLDILGASILWIFDTKTRKLIKYKANSDGFSIKGTTLANFNETESMAKALRKPLDQLSTFTKLNKIAMAKYFDELPTIAILAGGRLNENQILLKVF